MKIYFTGSIVGGRELQPIYKEIIDYLEIEGKHSVLTSHVGSADLDAGGEKQDPAYIFERDVQWLRESDVIIAEVTKPSLGVGYEIGLAEAKNKTIICLYNESLNMPLSSMIKGNKNLEIFNYKNLREVKEFLDKKLSYFVFPKI